MLVKLRRLWIQLTADRRRFGLLCAAVCIGMLLWARLIIVSRMPRTAIADDAANAKVAKDAAGAEGSIAESLRSSTPLHVRFFKSPARDPFVISPQFLPKANPIGPSSQSAGNTPKLPPNPVEESAQAQARITEHLRAAAESLKLEAAVAGSMAVINGKTYRLGDVIVSGGNSRESGNPAGSEPVEFRLAEVKTRSAVLECLNRRFEIHMPLPGGAGR